MLCSLIFLYCCQATSSQPIPVQKPSNLLSLVDGLRAANPPTGARTPIIQTRRPQLPMAQSSFSTLTLSLFLCRGLDYLDEHHCSSFMMEAVSSNTYTAFPLLTVISGVSTTHISSTADLGSL